jgi:predicted phage terminase large subunit-like protein
VDDFENDENVRNPRLVREGTDWLLGAVLGSFGPGFKMFMVGNIFARNSILAGLMAMKDGKGKDRYTSRVYRALDESGQPIWPELWPVHRLEEKKRLMGEVRFNREMMNLVADETGAIRPGWFEYYSPEEIEGKSLRIASFLDPSATSGEMSDFKAIVTVGLDEESLVHFVLHAWIRRATIRQMLDAAHAIHREYGGAFGVEVNMLEDFLLAAFEEYAREAGSWLPITGVRHTTGKEARILGAVAPLMEFGRLKFRRGHSDMDILVEQTLYLGDRTVNDDGPDALAGALSMLSTRGPKIW